MKIIGLHGDAGVGKDTAALALAECGYTRIAFADKVRDMALAIDPIVCPRTGTRLSSVVRGYGWEKAKRSVPGVRQALINIGIAARNVLGEDVWVDAALGHLSVDSKDTVVVTDMRFPNEARWIKALGGLVVHIDSTRVPPTTSEADRALDGYEFDVFLTNNGSEYAFREDVRLYLGSSKWYNFHTQAPSKRGGSFRARTL